MNPTQDEHPFRDLHDILRLDDEELESAICLISNAEIITLMQTNKDFKSAVFSVMSANANVVILRDLTKRELPTADDIKAATEHILNVSNELHRAGSITYK